MSTLHQSSLGALFLIAPSKIHPLWYSSYLPVYFFVTAVIAGFSMVIFETSLSHRFFYYKMDEQHINTENVLSIGFGKASSFILAGYFVIKLIGISSSNSWHYLFTGYGVWYLVELIGFVVIPSFLYAVGVRDKNVKLIQNTSILAILGVVLNRFNVSLVAFNWHLPLSDRYFPHWTEIGISVFIVTIGMLLYRFIVTRMPVLYKHSDYESH